MRVRIPCVTMAALLVAGAVSACDVDDDKCTLGDFAFFGTHYRHRSL